MKILTVLVMLFLIPINSHADSLVLIGYSYHYNYDENQEKVDYLKPGKRSIDSYSDKRSSNNTFGIGYEYRYIGVSLYKNSISNSSLMVYGKYDYNQYFSQSIGVASGYENTKIIPLTSFKYKNIRISTSYPIAKITNSTNDIVNVQYILKF